MKRINVYTDSSYSDKTEIGVLGLIVCDIDNNILLEDSVKVTKSLENSTISEFMAINRAVAIVNKLILEGEIKGKVKIVFCSDCQGAINKIKTKKGLNSLDERIFKHFLKECNHIYSKNMKLQFKYIPRSEEHIQYVDKQCRNKLRNYLKIAQPVILH